ncbi:hypothetical protein KP509_29G013200 [Ceratopteris richardii]|uniref:Uncharacterized protein n=1 Tax=Ceratopteris richardii TaxID=49495 RepID=A0A8T2R752_CERRI|nr:hypothetical protein KP509_29G013200 [Ceratopteris richardii]
MVGTTKLDQHITQGLTEFDVKFNQMPQADRTALEPDKIRSFLSMLDPSLRRELERILEDGATASGLTGNWENLGEAVHRLAQGQEQNQMQTPRTNERDVLGKIENDDTSHNPSKDESEITLLKTTVESIAKHMETLATEMATIKSMQEIRLRDQEKPKELEQNPRIQMPARRPFNQARRCLWCDDLDHPHWTCSLFKEAKDRNWVMEVDQKICDYVTKRPLASNYGKGGMKSFFEASTSQNIYACRLESDDSNCDFWNQVYDTASSGNSDIRAKTCWNEPVDMFSVYAHEINQH